MKTLRSLLLATAMLALAAIPGLASVDIGSPAPDFSLTDLNGQAHRLSEFKGKVVVLEWNNPDCPIVHKHYDSGNLPRLQQAEMARGVVWLLINSGAPGKQGGDYSAEQITAWLQARHSTPTAYLRDPTGQVGHLYSAKTTPHLFVITPGGLLAYEGAIDSIRSANPDDIPRATNYVKAALDDVAAGRPVAKATSQPYGCAVKY